MTSCPQCGADNLASFSYQIDTFGQMPVKKAGRHCSKCNYMDGDWKDIASDRPDKILLSDLENLNKKSRPRPLSKQGVRLWTPFLVVAFGISMLVLNGGTSLYGLIVLVLIWIVYLLNLLRADDD